VQEAMDVKTMVAWLFVTPHFVSHQETFSLGGTGAFNLSLATPVLNIANVVQNDSAKFHISWATTANPHFGQQRFGYSQVTCRVWRA